MKKIIGVVFLSIFLVLPNYVFAKVVSCNNNEYTINIEIEKEKLNINETTKLIVNSDYDYNIKYKYSNQNIVSIDKEGVVKALNEGSTIVNAEITFLSNDTSVSTCKVDLQIDVISSNSKLKNLQIEGLENKIDFNSDKLDYFITVPHNTEKISLIAEPYSNSAKVSGLGRVYLEDGINEYKIIVTASDNSSTTYKLTVVRDVASDDNYLKNLIVEGYILEPNFDKSIFEYKINVDKDVEDIVINAEANNKLASIKGTGKHKLASGENIYDISVTAENGNIQNYKLTINKLTGTSKLKSLTIKDKKFIEKDFNPEVYIYHVTIANDINSLEINAIPNDNESIEIIGNENLEIGDNNIFIKVSSKDKTTTTYKIIAKKLSKEEQETIQKNTKLLKILLYLFIGALIFMTISISIFVKKNLKKRR